MPDEQNSSGEAVATENRNPNLTPWPKGVSGNPAGKKKGTKSFIPLLRKLLSEKIEIKDSDGTILTMSRRKVMLLKWLELAMKGNPRAINAIIDRIDGKATQPIDLGDPVTGIKVTIVRPDDTKPAGDDGVRQDPISATELQNTP